VVGPRVVAGSVMRPACARVRAGPCSHTCTYVARGGSATAAGKEKPRREGSRDDSRRGATMVMSQRRHAGKSQQEWTGGGAAGRSRRGHEVTLAQQSDYGYHVRIELVLRRRALAQYVHVQVCKDTLIQKGKCNHIHIYLTGNSKWSQHSS
jgi:hypothetical protein